MRAASLEPITRPSLAARAADPAKRRPYFQRKFFHFMEALLRLGVTRTCGAFERYFQRKFFIALVSFFTEVGTTDRSTVDYFQRKFFHFTGDLPPSLGLRTTGAHD